MRGRRTPHSQAWAQPYRPRRAARRTSEVRGESYTRSTRGTNEATRVGETWPRAASLTTCTVGVWVTSGISTWSLNVSLDDETACPGSAADIVAAAACSRPSSAIGAARSADRPHVEKGAVNGSTTNVIRTTATPRYTA